MLIATGVIRPDNLKHAWSYMQAYQIVSVFVGPKPGPSSLPILTGISELCTTTVLDEKCRFLHCIEKMVMQLLAFAGLSDIADGLRMMRTWKVDTCLIAKGVQG